MINKKLAFVIVILVLTVGAAALIAGKMLNWRVSPIISDGPLTGPGFTLSSSNNITPAAELPAIPPEVTGLYVEMKDNTRKDNTIVVASVPLETGGGGTVVDSQSGEGDEESLTPRELPSGPKVEIVVTSETTIYLDTTDFSQSVPGETTTIQETVGEGTLDDLNSDSMVRVWGRKSGDRIIAEVLFYSSPVVVKSPGAQ